MATLTDANGNLTSYEYDGLDRRATTHYPNPSAPGSSSTTDYEQYGYDADGNLATLRTRSGQSIVIGYVWDNAGRLTATTAGGRTLAYQYDAAGNRTRVTWPEASPFYVTIGRDTRCLL